MSAAAVARLYHPTTEGRIDVFLVDSNGQIRQKYWNGSTWVANTLDTGSDRAEADSTPVAEWTGDGSRVDVWCRSSEDGKFLQWFFTGGTQYHSVH